MTWYSTETTFGFIIWQWDIIRTSMSVTKVFFIPLVFVSTSTAKFMLVVVLDLNSLETMISMIGMIPAVNTEICIICKSTVKAMEKN